MDSSTEKSNASRSAGSGANPALVVGLIAVTLIALALGAYIYFKGGGLARPTPIGEVTSNLREWDGQPVTIKGTVSAPVNAFGLAKAFRLTDDTGNIMVVTEKGLPSDGAEVTVNGYVKQMFEFAGVQQTIVYESAGEEE
jgi:hypothetical protein